MKNTDWILIVLISAVLFLLLIIYFTISSDKDKCIQQPYFYSFNKIAKDFNIENFECYCNGGITINATSIKRFNNLNQYLNYSER